MNTSKLLAAVVLATVSGAGCRIYGGNESDATNDIRNGVGSVPSRIPSGEIGSPSELASLERANEWLNSPPLTAEALREKSSSSISGPTLPSTG